MNTKIIYSIAVLAVAVLAAINVSVNARGNGSSDIALANVEALAYELGEVTITCGQYYGQCWKNYNYFSGEYTIPCGWSGSQSDFCM
jgi:hypothetical protein